MYIELSTSQLFWIAIKMHHKRCAERVSWIHLTTLKWPFNWTGALCNCNRQIKIYKWLSSKPAFQKLLVNYSNSE